MNKGGEYEVREIRSSDYSSLKHFYQEFFPQSSKLNNHTLWLWEFTQSPSVGTGAPFFVLVRDGRIYGAIGCLVRKLQIGGQCVDACHPVDFFVDDNCKGFPALRLFRAVFGGSDVFFASYVSEDVARLTSAHGFLNLNDSLKKYNYVLGLPFENVIGFAFMRSVAVKLVRRLLALRVSVNIKKNRMALVYVESEEVLPEFVPSEMEQNIPGRIGLIKNYKYIRWRYQESPVLNCTYFSQSKHGKANCLFVVHVQRDKRALVLLDVIRATSEPLEIAHGLLMVIKAFRSKGYKFLSTTAMSPALHKAFLLLGFGVEDSNHRFVYYAKSKELLQSMAEATSWDFNLGDTDVY